MCLFCWPTHALLTSHRGVGTPARVQINCHLVSNDVLKPVVLLHTFAYISGRCQSVCCLAKIVSAQLCASHSQLYARAIGNCSHHWWIIILKNLISNLCYCSEVQYHFLLFTDVKNFTSVKITPTYCCSLAYTICVAFLHALSVKKKKLNFARC